MTHPEIPVDGRAGLRPERHDPALAAFPAPHDGQPARSGDWGPTPHGANLALVVAGRFPFYLDFSLEVVGIEDAARAMILAAEHGQVGERYIISDRFMSSREVNEVAAQAARVRPPRIKLPLRFLYAAAHVNDLAARLLPFAVVGLRMATTMSPLDHSKEPEPVEDSIR